MMSLTAVVAAALTPGLDRVPGSTNLMVGPGSLLDSSARRSGQPSSLGKTAAAYFGGRPGFGGGWMISCASCVV